MLSVFCGLFLCVVVQSRFLYYHYHILDYITCLSVGREADAPYSHHPPHFLPLTFHSDNRAVTLVLTRTESINTLTLFALPQETWAMDDSTIALQPPYLHQRWHMMIGWAGLCGAGLHWQPCPKSLGRPWHGASQLSQGQK